MRYLRVDTCWSQDGLKVGVFFRAAVEAAGEPVREPSPEGPWWCREPTQKLPASQDGVELGVFFREAMEAAGQPFSKLAPEQIAATLRKYETARSHRVAQVIAGSIKTGNLFRRAGFLVSGALSMNVLATMMCV